MICEKCGRNTDIIKHIHVPDYVFHFNASHDAMVCVPCWNNAPPMKGVREVEEIRNDKMPGM